MAIIRPFNALRPDKKIAHLAASVPYDVVNREEAAANAENNPLSYLRITRSEIELDPAINPYSAEVYEKAKENLDRIKREAPLFIDAKPYFYLYKLVMGSQSQVGIAATFSVEDYDNNIILKHEKTRKEKEDDRTNHIVTTEAQTGPVFLTYRGVAAVNEIVDKVMSVQEPEYDFTAPDGIRHTIWILPEEYNSTVISEIANVKNLYIADGHHRAASAARAQKVKKNSNPGHTGNEEYNFFLAVLFPAEQLKILPYNRIVHDLNGLTRDQLMEKIKEYFSIEETGSPNPPERKTFAMYLPENTGKGKWFLLRANHKVIFSDNIGDNLDVSILQNYLLKPILGVDDPRTSKRIDFIGGIRGTGELEKLADSGKAAAAFSLFPLLVDDLMNISDAGEIMPPKSTWFEPKLRDGLLVHLIK
jgi:uncharacterized protein (DUF1015 family)